MSAREELHKRARSNLGKTLGGKWRLDEVLGVGGMASVYGATHRNGHRVALKLLHPELATVPDIRQRFLREGYIANKIGHRGAVAVVDDHEDQGTVFLVMELLDGDTLYARWQKHAGRMPVEDALPVLDQVLDVLAAAHEQGIVHRDLKPENIFITRSGQVKLLDFGIARVRELTATWQVDTRTGVTLGTPGFMAPEQARGLRQLIDGQTDLWAVGAMLFTLLSGKPVHRGESQNEQLVAAAMVPPPSLGSLLPDLPPSVILLVDRALAFEKQDRWPSARAMQMALRDAMRASGAVPLQVISIRPEPRARSSAAPGAGSTSTTETPPSLWVAELSARSADEVRALAEGTLVSAQAPPLPSTGGAVAMPPTETGPRLTVFLSRRPFAAAGALAAIAVVLVIAALVRLGRTPEMTGESPAPTRPVLASAPPEAAPVAAVEAVPSASVSAAALPSAAPAPAPSPSSPRGAPAPAKSAAEGGGGWLDRRK